MRKILLFALLVMVSTSAFSQMNADYNYSIAVHGYTIKQMPKILDESGSRYFTYAPLNGIMVKFNDNQIGYRLNGTYYSKSKEFYNRCETCDAANGKLVDYSFKVGFEKNFNYSRIQPYFGIDLGYRSNTFTGDLENRNEDIIGLESIEASKMGMVITPFLGIKISPIEQLSIFAEGNIDFFYFYERQESNMEGPENIRTVNNYHKGEFLLNPLSVGIQFHLGNNK